MDKKRFLELDYITGFAITLVVIGHLASRGAEGIDWYVTLKVVIYKFHMPLFMFASGAISFIKIETIGRINYRSFSVDRARRLIYPYLLFAALIIFGKSLVFAVLPTDNYNGDLFNSLKLALFFTSESPAGSLWYLVTLFQLCLSLPPLLLLHGRSLSRLMVTAGVVSVLGLAIDFPTIFGINLYCEYLLFFTFGAVYMSKRDTFITVITVYRAYIAVGALAAMIILYGIMNSLSPDITKLGIGLASIPFFIAISSGLVGGWLGNVLILLASFSMSIYLMNTIFIGLLKGCLILMFGDVSSAINYGFFPLVGAGIFGPILLQRYFLEGTRIASLTR